jgi:hypothetical protein
MRKWFKQWLLIKLWDYLKVEETIHAAVTEEVLKYDQRIRRVLQNRRVDAERGDLGDSLHVLIDQLENREQAFDRLARLLRAIVYDAIPQPEHPEPNFRISPNNLEEATGLLNHLAGRPPLAGR